MKEYEEEDENKEPVKCWIRKVVDEISPDSEGIKMPGEESECKLNADDSNPEKACGSGSGMDYCKNVDEETGMCKDNMVDQSEDVGGKDETEKEVTDYDTYYEYENVEEDIDDDEGM
ncbi:hypothetical protein RF11_01707 [Thelohanellus kitauei]|uniref:Uncharacterized protein n=1 Tax=Thelohanellus kitauei TaxID=669202 RepID=A0A0C2J3T3_THEKT|nr:hypothetical protein RF11_01707 [Thelohanellus kitauei]